MIDEKKSLENKEWEIILRAATIVAGQKIIDQAENQFNSSDLDYYLWKQGKEPAFRSNERHAVKDTIYY